MRWAIFICLLVAKCGNAPGEKPIAMNNTKSSTDTPLLTQELPADSSLNYAKDSSLVPLPKPLPVKTPSGIWEFLFNYDDNTQILHTISFSQHIFRLQEEYLGKKDSVVITEGTWAPSQGLIWLYKDQLVRGRYTWQGDTLQYFSPRLNKKFAMMKLMPASANPVWLTKKKEGAVLYGIGTEPFWSIEVKRKDSIILNMPDLAEPFRVKLSGVSRENKTTVYSSALSDSLQITISPYFCSDGMSDFTYSNRMIVTYKGRTLQGCGEVF